MNRRLKIDIQTVPALILITVNVLLFLISVFRPGFEDAFGISVQSVLVEGDYFRLVKYMFMHAGWQHILANMVLLFFISSMNLGLQSVLKYVVVYFSSGILGGLLELFLRSRLFPGSDVFAIGASGAIMGLVGSTLVLFLVKRKALPKEARRDTIIRLLLLTAVNLVPTSGSVDYLGHASGFVVGAALTFLLSLGSLIRPEEAVEDDEPVSEE